MKTIAFFNHKGGVGKTSLAYHLAWMYADMGLSVIAADFDPQANLTAMCLTEERLEALWTPCAPARATVYDAFAPLLEGTGDIAAPHLETIAPGLELLVGDLKLATVEDQFSRQWPACLDAQPRAFRVLSGLWRILDQAARHARADLVLIDVGPNLGSLNRVALVAADWVVIPLAPDLYSLQGLRNLGPILAQWRQGWQERLQKAPASLTISLPPGTMQPVGYVVWQRAVRLDRPVKAYSRWRARIPHEYSQSVLDACPPQGSEEPHCLARLRHYRSLMPMAQEAQKPMFKLKPADGAIGSQVATVTTCYRDFRRLAQNIAAGCDLPLPDWLD